MGWRALRLGLDRPGLLRTQVRALLRAAAGRELRLMFPMVSEVEEFHRAKDLVDRELRHSRRHGHAVPDAIRLGTMIEVPRAAVTAHQIAEVAEFFSFGTNDLTQATLGLSRSRSRAARPESFSCREASGDGPSTCTMRTTEPAMPSWSCAEAALLGFQRTWTYWSTQWTSLRTDDCRRTTTDTGWTIDRTR